MIIDRRYRVMMLIAGTVIWLAVGAVFPLCTGGWTYLLPTVVAYTVFGAAFWYLTMYDVRDVRRAGLLLALESAAALLILSLHPYYIAANLLVIVGWQIALVYRTRLAIALIIAQALVPAIGLSTVYPMALIWPYLVAITGFQLFGVATARIAAGEALARADESRTLKELRLAQARLADAARNEERLRIARDLHDILGHSLTGLTTQLDVAGALTEGEAHDHVRIARTLSNTLLDQVRGAVDIMRRSDDDTLSGKLDRIAADWPMIDVAVRIDPEAGPLAGPEAAAIVRLAQEAVTNAVRHGGATCVSVDVGCSPEGLRVTAVDNGGGARTVVPGNGLTGMRERFEELGGSLRVVAGSGSGFRVEALIPA